MHGLSSQPDLQRPKLFGRVATKRTARQYTRVLMAFAMMFAAFYLVLSPMFAMPLYDRILFDPDYDGNFYPAKIANCTVETVWLTAPDGNRVFAWYVHNPRAKKTVLLSHGNGGDLIDRIPLIEKFVSCGASVFAYDYEGFGLSHGNCTLQSICEDGLAAYDYLTKKRNVKPKALVLAGESLGTGVTCQIASQRHADSIVLQSAFTSLLDVARLHQPWLWLYPDNLMPSQRLDVLSFLKGKHPAVLLVHGERDPVVPVGEAITNFQDASYPKQLVLLPDAQHDDASTQDAATYNGALRRFLQRV